MRDINCKAKGMIAQGISYIIASQRDPTTVEEPEESKVPMKACDASTGDGLLVASIRIIDPSSQQLPRRQLQPAHVVSP